MSPQEIVREIRHRVFKSKKAELDSLIMSAKHMRVQRPYDFLSRYESILSRNCGWIPLDFKGKKVLEIGCGPVLGFGPLAIYRGCDQFVGIEPEFNDLVLTSPEIIEKYFLKVYKDLAAIYGGSVTFDSYFRDLKEKTVVIKKELLDTELQGHFDIILSNSALEHIFPFKETLHPLYEVSTRDTRFLHLVDFGNHRLTKNPFDGIYDFEPKNYFHSYGKQINLIRPAEMLGIMREIGFEAQMVAYYYYSENYSGKVCDFWQAQIKKEEMFLKTAIIAGPLRN